MLPKTKQTAKITKTAKTGTTAKVVKVKKTALTAKADAVAKPTKMVKPAQVAKAETLAQAVKPVKTAKAAKKVKPDLTNLKRLSAGQRTHERRMKQAARQEGSVYHSLIIRQVVAKKAE